MRDRAPTPPAGGVRTSLTSFTAVGRRKRSTARVLLQPGSGNTIDMSLLVPVSSFDQSQQFVYLYSAYGFQGGSWATNDGFEEWVTQPGTGLSGHKFNDLNANGINNSGEPLLSGWTVYIDVNNDDVLEASEPELIWPKNGFGTWVSSEFPCDRRAGFI